MRTLLLLSLVMFLAVPAAADNSSEARKVLDKVAAVVGDKDGVSAAFAMSNDQTGMLKGTIAVKGNKFRAETQGVIVWYDGTTQWAYMERTDEVTITTPTPQQQAAMNALTFITLYKTGYTLSLATVDGKWEARMVAQDKNKEIQEAYIVIDKTTYVPTQVRMRRGSKWTIINISAFARTPQSDSTFTFSPAAFPTADIVDLR